MARHELFGQVRQDAAVLPEVATVPTTITDAEQLFAVDVNGIGSFRAVSPTGLVTDIQRDDSLIVRNETGSTIAKGAVVYIAGASAAAYGLPATYLPLVALARGNSTSTMPAIGVTLQSIATGSAGRVLRAGMLTGVDTSGYTVGQRLWVSTSTAGALTNSEPLDRVQRIGFVVRVHATEGQILVDTRAMGAISEGTLVPSGGASGAALVKSSATNWDSTWRALTAADVASGTLDAARLPAVLSPVRTVTYAASITVDPTVSGTNVSVTATGDVTSLAVSTTGAVNRQGLEIVVLASGANRAITIASAIRTSTGITRGPYTIDSGQIGIFLVRYYALISAWVLVAATESAT